LLIDFSAEHIDAIESVTDVHYQDPRSGRHTLIYYAQLPRSDANSAILRDPTWKGLGLSPTGNVDTALAFCCDGGRVVVRLL
jgi:hypothetical protein